MNKSSFTEIDNIPFGKIPKPTDGKTPKPTEPTEQEILKKFEELGYVIEQKTDINEIFLINKHTDCKIVINKNRKFYYIRELYTPEYQTLLLQEHQLLTELFKCWGWI